MTTGGNTLPGQEPDTTPQTSPGENPVTTTTAHTPPFPLETPTPSSPPASTLPNQVPDLNDESAWTGMPKWVRDLRSEAAARRVEANTLKEKVDTYEREKLTDLEKLQADIRKLNEDVLPEKDKTIRQLQVQVAAAQSGVVDPDAVVQLLDWSKVDGGMSINDAINDLLESKPYLKATAQTTPLPTPTTPTTPPSTTAPGAPGTPTTQAQSFTQQQIANMSEGEYEANREAIFAALTSGRLK